jgi:AcrR family transcriptional regulator
MSSKSNLPTESKKLPKQERSRRTYQLILDSASLVIRQEGMEKLSTNRVAAVAGISIGSLYQYFPTKVAIVAALIEQTFESEKSHVRSFLSELAAGTRADEAAQRIFRHYYRFEKAEFVLRKALVDLTPAAERAAAAMKYHGACANIIVGFFTSHFPVGAKDLSQATFVLKYILKGLTLSSVDAQVEALEPELLVSQWAEILLTLLHVPADARMTANTFSA